MLEREEYVEQAYFFQVLAERSRQNMATQDLMQSIREELLSTTKLPLAIDYLTSELKLHGVFAPAMAKLSHYFTPFQTFVVEMAESERGRFDFGVGLAILQRDALYRTEKITPPGMFMFQFETLCRNRLGYDKGLAAVAGDPIFDEGWRDWIFTVRRQVGIVELADLIYVRSEHYRHTRTQQGLPEETPDKPVLFGMKEGKIALANRRKDPLFLFSALQRHLNYPVVPRPTPVDESRFVLPTVLRRVDRLEARLKLLEEEQKGGIDLSKFYGAKPTDLDDGI